MKNSKIILSVLMAVVYFGMIGINALANILPINNTTTGDISNAYPNLFAPAAVTFSIWGVIYLLLAGYVFYRFSQKDKDKHHFLESVDNYFIVSSVANIFWIFSWHYRLIGLSVVFMLVILYSLIKIADNVNHQKFTFIENILIKTPFSIYFGWITVAAIANITTLLVSIGWSGFGLSNQFWMVTILFVGAAIGLTRMLKDQNIAYGLVLIWAYLGIWIKHTSTYAYQYEAVITSVIICIGLFILAEGKICFSNYTSSRLSRS